MPDIVFTRHEGKPDRAKLDVQEAVGYFEHLIGSKSRINHKRISGQMHRCGAQGATLVLKSDCLKWTPDSRQQFKQDTVVRNG